MTAATQGQASLQYEIDRIREARKFKDGGVSQCFHCQSQLVRIKGGFIYAELETPDGHKVRVHKQCLNEACGDGYKDAKAGAA